MSPMHQSPLDVVILALEAHGSRVRPRGNTGASAQCPAHDDRDPSLSVDLGDCGLCVVIKCHGHCDTAAVLDALALAYPDLRHPDCDTHRSSRQPGHAPPAARNRTQPRTRPVPDPGGRRSTTTQEPDAPADWPNLGRPDATFTYCDADGTIVGEIRKYEYWHAGKRVRKTFRPFRVAPNGRMKVGKWDEPVLYRLPQLLAAACSDAAVYICEGEADADAMAEHGVTATSAPFGADSAWLPEYTEQLRGAGGIVVLRDKDDAGRARANTLHAALTAAGFSAWIAEAAEGKDAREHFAAGRTLEQLVQVDAPTATPNPEPTAGAVPRARAIDYGGWEEPVSLDAKRMPAFPVKLLGPLAPMVEAVAEAYQVPPDLPALSTLATVATAVGGRRLVFPRPDWKEASPLWALSALPSGDRKSPAMDAVTAPLAEMERELSADKGPQVEALKQEHRILADRMAEAERAAASRKSASSDRSDAKADAEALRQEIAELGHPPELPQLVGGDCTPESLGLHLAEQHGRIGIHTSEAGLFGTFAGRYSNKIPNLDLALEGYRGGPYRLKRVTRAAIDLPAMNLTLNMCIQPGILQGLAAQRENNFRETGFLARFLFSIPTSLVGRRNPDPRPIPDQIRFEYHQAVKRLVREIWDTDTPQAMKLHPRAASELMEFTIALEPRLGAYGDLGPLTDWAAKLAGNLVRVATMLTVYQDPGAQVVGECEMRCALAMAPYLIAHAWRAFDLMGNDVYGRLEPARNIVAWLRKRATGLRASGEDPLAPFTVRDAHRALGGRAWVKDGGTEAVHGALADLVDYGWIAAGDVADAALRGRGRPGAPAYELHPLLAEPLDRGGVPGDVTEA